MYKHRIFSILLILCLVLTCTACTPSAQTSGEMSDDTAAAVSATLTAIASASTEAPAAQPTYEGTQYACSFFSLVLPSDIASGASCIEMVEFNQPNQESFPAHYLITLENYPVANHFFQPQIRVYPVADYQRILPDMFNSRYTELQSLIAGGQPGEGSLPLLPEIRAMQEFDAQYQVMPFANGSGIRYLTMYSQAYLPVNNYEMIYTYQGLTADGQWWVSVIMPITFPGLPADNTTPPGGDWNAFIENFTTYISDTTNQLDQASGDSYLPSIETLDRMVASIQVNP